MPPISTSSTPRLTNAQKLEICLHKRAHPNLTQLGLSHWSKEKFSLPKALSQAAISKILANAKNLENMTQVESQAKRPRIAQYPELESALANWNAVDREERGEANVYNVDQLAAMRWCKAAWTDIPGEIIENCFNHTGLFDTISVHPENHPLEQAIVAETTDALQQLSSISPMDIRNFLNPMPEEDAYVHQEFTDEELLEHSIQEDEEIEEEEDIPVKPTSKEKLLILQQALSILELDDPLQAALHKSLRCLQAHLRGRKLKQTMLDSWIN
ncbi:hypothetical protein FRX31_018152 [Thalictrum thalictroides]|uniref:DDE-1 domain-containing protein n=1 Tax=Thalictrum thalictroides TaxID=46969 RepID=A0A7J6W4X6_THATH|nr:hypothetical protein FRX31_018152 [Thalictrum thalictroides]